MKKVIFFLILAFFILAKPTLAQNTYGIHILSANDLPKAAELLNSEGGDWGYVTIVIREDEMDRGAWQNFFDQCRKLHLLPLVRIATRQTTDFWEKPTEEDIEKWASFFDSLNWPTKNRYLIFYNEPNQTQEWGGQTDPIGYAKLLIKAISIFKSKNSDYQILNAGFDMAAPNSFKTQDALPFWQKMSEVDSNIFNLLDGWVSHSYPNHGFIGTPYQTGRTSVRGYVWELGILKSRFGLKKDLPVFITETGWPYRINRVDRFYPIDKAAENLAYTFENIWNKDSRIKAVTPFVLNYPQAPFGNFSFLKENNQETILYQKIKSLAKKSWQPEQNFSLEIDKIHLPPFLPAETEFKGFLVLKNTGQSIWAEKEPLRFLPKQSDKNLIVSPLEIATKVQPFQKTQVEFILKSGAQKGEYLLSWENLPEYKIKVFSPSLIIKAEFHFWDKIITWAQRKWYNLHD